TRRSSSGSQSRRSDAGLMDVGNAYELLEFLRVGKLGIVCPHTIKSFAETVNASDRRVANNRGNQVEHRLRRRRIENIRCFRNGIDARVPSRVLRLNERNDDACGFREGRPRTAKDLHELEG